MACKIKQGIVKFFRFFFSKEFVVFLAIGLFNTFNGSLLSYVFSVFINANLAFVIGYILSLSIAYVLNCFFAFKQKLSLKGYLKFCVSYLPNFFIQNLIVFLVYNQLGLHRLIAYVSAAALGVPITFLIVKFFAMATGNVRQKDTESK